MLRAHIAACTLDIAGSCRGVEHQGADRALQLLLAAGVNAHALALQYSVWVYVQAHNHGVAQPCFDEGVGKALVSAGVDAHAGPGKQRMNLGVAALSEKAQIRRLRNVTHQRDTPGLRVRRLLADHDEFNALEVLQRASQAHEELGALQLLEVRDPGDGGGTGLVDLLRSLRLELGHQLIGAAAVVAPQQLHLPPVLHDDAPGKADTERNAPFLQATAHEIAATIEALMREIGIAGGMPDESCPMATRVEGTDARVSTGHALVDDLRVDAP